MAALRRGPAVDRPGSKGDVPRRPARGLCREDAAAAAGFSLTGFYGARRRDPGFALAAQARLRRVVESAADAPHRALLADEGAEFDRIMKLLDYFDRKPNRPATRFRPDSRHAPWSFERAIKTLDKALDALGDRRTPFLKEEGEPEPAA